MVKARSSTIHKVRRENHFRKDLFSFAIENGLWKPKNAKFQGPSIKSFYLVSKNPLGTFIGMYKAMEFHMPPYEIPQ